MEKAQLSGPPAGPWGSAEALEVESAAGELARRLADRLDLDVDVVVTAKRGDEEISIGMSAVRLPGMFARARRATAIERIKNGAETQQAEEESVRLAG